MGRTAMVPRPGRNWAGRRLAAAAVFAALVGVAGTGVAADWLAGTAATTTQAEGGATLAHTRSGAPPPALRLTFPGSVAATIAGEGRPPGAASARPGVDRVAGAPSLGRVVYRGAWPGVDIAFHGDARHLAYALLVAPGADPGRIRLGFDGQRSLRVTARGGLRLALPGGRVVRAFAPVAHQLVGGRRHAVASRFVLAGPGQLGVVVGRYDVRSRLVIDPVLAYGA